MIHEEKIEVIKDAALRKKIMEGAFLHAKSVLLATTAQQKSVKLFAQVVLKEIAQENPHWLDGLAYFTLSNNVSLTPQAALQATQAVVSAEVQTVFPYYAKAQYGDIS